MDKPRRTNRGGILALLSVTLGVGILFAGLGVPPGTPEWEVMKAEEERLRKPAVWMQVTRPVETTALVFKPAPRELSGPYFHLPMDDNAADPVVHDATSDQQDQTFVDWGGNPHTNAHSVPGVIGTALEFDGVDDYINLGAEFASDILGPGHSFTYSLWAKAPSSAPASTEYVISKHHNVEVSFDPSGSTTLQIGARSDVRTVIPNSMDGDFHHFVILRRGPGIELWYDGERKEKTQPRSRYDVVALNDPTKNLTLGIRFNGTGAYQGRIDDFRMYDRALTSSEIKALAAVPSKPPTQPAISDKITALFNNLSITISDWLEDLGVSDITTALLTNPAPMDGSSIQGSESAGEFPGLYFHLTMDDNASDPMVHDAASGEQHQTLVDPDGDPNTNAHSAPGVVGSALAFDGVDDHMNLGAEFASDILDGGHDFTYSLWAKAPSFAPAATQYVLSKGNDAEIRFDRSGSTTFQIPMPFIRAVISNSLDGNFHHFVILRRSETIELWYDGDLERTNTHPNYLWALSSNELKLGIRFDGTGAYQGAIDDFRMYDRALSESDIKALAVVLRTAAGLDTFLNKLAPRELSGPYFHLPMDDNAADPMVHDATSDQQHQTFVDRGGNPNTNAHSVPGVIDTALEFNGVHDYINLGAEFASDILGHGHSFTYSLWAKAPSSAPASTEYVISKHHNVEVSFDPSGSTTLQIRAGSDVRTVIPNSMDGDFHHFVILRRGPGRIELWYDGERKEQHTHPSHVVALNDPTKNLTLGIRFNGTGAYQGRMDDFRMYDRALTSSEIKALAAVPSKPAVSKPPTQPVVSDKTTALPNKPAPMDGSSIQGSESASEFPGLYFHLTMDDNASDPMVHDAASGQRHQTFLDPDGDPNTQAHGAPGVVGSALAFDGEDDHINLGAEFASDILGYGHDFTYSVWAKAPSFAPAETQYVLSKHYKVEINFNPDSSTALMISPSRNLGTLIPNSMDGNFHHFVILRRGETIELWYDGDLIRTDTNPSHLVALNDPTKNLTLGIRFNGARHYQGVIDDFRMYDRALSEAEIRALAVVL